MIISPIVISIPIIEHSFLQGEHNSPELDLSLRPNDLMLAPASSIKEKCVYLTAHDYIFISLLPNSIELE